MSEAVENEAQEAIYTEGKAKTYTPKASGSGEGPKDVFINPIQCMVPKSP